MLLHRLPSPPITPQDTGTYLLLFQVGVVQDDGRVTLPPQVIENSVVFHPGWRGFLGLVHFPETEGGEY